MYDYGGALKLLFRKKLDAQKIKKPSLSLGIALMEQVTGIEPA